ncbi:glycoside hydrolase family 9 protein [Klenkia terrae]|uniref:Glycoside hydrolase family 9 protein n=1 Tax=Klenkia terrae TaxID=1052259 RepID=A0ABU8EA96_9ACTN|nr:glycoside hydrolase family 9 protein [Klenkia terrae]
MAADDRAGQPVEVAGQPGETGQQTLGADDHQWGRVEGQVGPERAVHGAQPRRPGSIAAVAVALDPAAAPVPAGSPVRGRAGLPVHREPGHRRQEAVTEAVEQAGLPVGQHQHDVARGAVQGPDQVACGEGGVDDRPVDDLDRQRPR